jgi:hypothetical protein
MTHPVPPAAAPIPPAPAPAPALQPPVLPPAQPATGSGQLNVPTLTPPPGLPAGQPPAARPSGPETGDDGLPYYQEGVPWRNLPPDQQVAYWMHRSRKHEDRVNGMRDYDELKAVKGQYDQLLTQSQTEHERAVAEARRQGEQVAMARGNTMLVEAYVRAAAASRGVDEEAVSDFLDTTRLDAFINAATGQVDTAKVYRQVNRMAGNGAPQAVPAGVPAAPAVPMPPMQAQVPQPPAQPGWPQQQVPGQPVQTYATGGAVQWTGQPPGQPVPAAPVPQWPGHIPAAPTGAPGQPAPVSGPDFGQGQFHQAPPSGLEAGRAAARARFGEPAKTTNPRA